MPVYLHSCHHCGEMELERPMAAKAPTRCPSCKRPGLTRIYSLCVIGACDANQEAENNGLGKFYPQMGARYLDAKTKRRPNPAAHARSRNEAIEKLKRRGYSDIEKA